jgi:lipopolysaccharide transport system permease protein
VSAAEADTSVELPVRQIRPSRGWFDLRLIDVWRARDLVENLIVRDLKVYYRQAAIGIAWAVLQPLLAVAIFTMVFGRLARMPSDGVPYPVFAFAAVLPWTYFAEAVRRGGLCLVNDAELVRKVSFPRLVMPLAAVTTPLIDLLMGFIVLLGLMFVYHVTPSWRIVAALPPLILVSWALALAIGLWFSPINVRFRDVKLTLPFMLQIWMYLSPVIYPLSIIPERLRWLYSLNPMVGVIEGFRWALFGKGAPDLTALSIGAGAIVVLLFGGLAFFRRMENSFADLI